MIGICARNVNDAFLMGWDLLSHYGELQESRAGPVLVAPFPVVTCYEKPQERILFHHKRDANPVFHLMEALWMLAGRNDATWLDQFVKDFSARFAEADGIQHGAYGFRWRHHFDVEGGGELGRLPDQLKTIIEMLRQNPDDRRAVLTMWDPVADLGVNKKDVPCNSHGYFRVRRQDEVTVPVLTEQERRERRLKLNYHFHVLDITICCRSNDMCWGAYGANAVHFSILQEYVAALLGIGIGNYYQLSNNFHLYLDQKKRLDPIVATPNPYQTKDISPTSIVTVPNQFGKDLALFFDSLNWTGVGWYSNCFFSQVAVPLRLAYACWRNKDWASAEFWGSKVEGDWGLAFTEWLERRKPKGQ